MKSHAHVHLAGKLPVSGSGFPRRKDIKAVQRASMDFVVKNRTVSVAGVLRIEKAPPPIGNKLILYSYLIMQPFEIIILFI